MLKRGNNPTSVGPKTNELNTATHMPHCISRRVSKRIADLQWRITFTQMKLNHWQEQENCRWQVLVGMQEQAKRELRAVAS